VDRYARDYSSSARTTACEYVDKARTVAAALQIGEVKKAFERLGEQKRNANRLF